MTASELIVMLKAQVEMGRGDIPLWVEPTCPSCYARRGFRVGEMIALNFRGDRLVVETVATIGKEAPNDQR